MCRAYHVDTTSNLSGEYRVILTQFQIPNYCFKKDGVLLVPQSRNICIICIKNRSNRSSKHRIKLCFCLQKTQSIISFFLKFKQMPCFLFKSSYFNSNNHQSSVCVNCHCKRQTQKSSAETLMYLDKMLLTADNKVSA